MKAGRVLAIAAFVAALAPSVHAGDDDSVRAAFLFNLAKYVDWPEASFSASESPFVVCVLEDAKFAQELTNVVGERRVDGRGFEVAVVADRDAVAACHMLFGLHDQRKLARALAHEIQGKPILTVAEYDRFTRVGGMVGVEVKRGKVGFDVNRSTADRAGLKISSKLLRLASAVR